MDGLYQQEPFRKGIYQLESTTPKQIPYRSRTCIFAIRTNKPEWMRLKSVASIFYKAILVNLNTHTLTIAIEGIGLREYRNV